MGLLLASMMPAFSSFSSFFQVISWIQTFYFSRSSPMHRATTVHRISRPVMKTMFVTLFIVQLFSYFGVLFSLQAAHCARNQVFLSARTPRDSTLFEKYPIAQNILWSSQLSIRICSIIILILWNPCLALKFLLSRPMRLPPPCLTVAQLLLSFIGIVLYFLAARSVRQIHSLLPVETHIRYIVSHVVPITVCTLPRRCIWSRSFGGTSMAYLPAFIRDFLLFFDILNFWLTAMIQFFAMTLFLLSGHENSRTLQLPMLYLLPRAPAMPFMPSGKACSLLF